MAMVLQQSRLRLTQAIFFGRPGAGGGGTVTSLTQGSGVTLTPNPTTATGIIRLGALTADWNPGNFNINSRNSMSVFNVVAYGADPTGVNVGATDTAITNAIAAAAAVSPRGVVYFPQGTFSTTGGFNLDGLDGLNIHGAGQRATTINIVHATNDLFTTGNSVTSYLNFRDFTVSSSIVRTGGWVFRCTTPWNGTGFLNHSQFSNITILNQHNGIWLSRYLWVWLNNIDTLSWVGVGGGVAFKMGQTAAGATNQGAEAYLSHCQVTGTDSGGVTPTLGTGFWIEDCSAVYLDQCGSTQVENESLHIVANAGGPTCGNHFFSTSVFDETLNSHCASITGTGTIVRLKFTGCWFAGGGREPGGLNIANGCKIDSAPIDFIEFTGCTFYNTNGAGLYIAPTGPTFCQVNVVGCIFESCGLGAQANNNCGIYVNSNLNFSAPNIVGCQEILSNAFSIVTSATSNMLTLYGNNFKTVPSFGTPPKGQYFVQGGGLIDQVLEPKVGIGATPTRELDLTGTQRFRGIAAPAVSEANSGTIYFDSATNKLKASLNGSAYVDVIGSAGLTGSGVATYLTVWDSPASVTATPSAVTNGNGIGIGATYAGGPGAGIGLGVDGDIDLATGKVLSIAGGTILASDAGNNIVKVGDGIGAVGAGSTIVGSTAMNAGTATNATIFGYGAGPVITGDANTGIGRFALLGTTSGTNNVGIGQSAGFTNTTGGNNVFLGYEANASVGNLSNAVAIGFQSTVAASDSMALGNASMKVGIHTTTPKTGLDVDSAVCTRHKDIVLVNGLNSDIALTDTSWVRFTGPTLAFSIGGFTGGTDGRILRVLNTTANAMTIVNLDGSSVATNRITTLTGGDVVLAARTSAATFIYEDVSDTWILMSTN